MSQIDQTSPSAKAAQAGTPAKPDSFEKNLERLDAIVRKLEDAELPLERALELYEEGMGLSGICQQQLEAAEGRVEILRKRAGGKVVAEPFDPEARNAASEE
ncbi:MAG TPA: exodeoxyribonuclease VII small subunit [Terriglobia bacterium]|nr:exodeoxyribonuclease VII small subunit [Terriglobia bacterium]